MKSQLSAIRCLLPGSTLTTDQQPHTSLNSLSHMLTASAARRHLGLGIPLRAGGTPMRHGKNTELPGIAVVAMGTRVTQGAYFA
jgi:hypothetical protein